MCNLVKCRGKYKRHLQKCRGKKSLTVRSEKRHNVGLGFMDLELVSCNGGLLEVICAPASEKGAGICTIAAYVDH